VPQLLKNTYAWPAGQWPSMVLRWRAPNEVENRLAQGSVGESITITAKHQDGVFKSLEDVSMSEGTIFEVRVLSNADRLKRL
jgi:hypothetical protein